MFACNQPTNNIEVIRLGKKYSFYLQQDRNKNELRSNTYVLPDDAVVTKIEMCPFYSVAVIVARFRQNMNYMCLCAIIRWHICVVICSFLEQDFYQKHWRQLWKPPNSMQYFIIYILAKKKIERNKEKNTMYYFVIQILRK